jgi:hypothetical protein
MRSNYFSSLSLTVFLTACAQAPAVRPPPTSPIPSPMAMVDSSMPPNVNEPAPRPTIPPPQEEVAAKPEAAAALVQDSVWKMKKGKLSGPGAVSAKIIAQDKDEKSGQTTVTRCWKYKGFALVELKSSGEVGAGELNIRRGDKLCAADFKGHSDNLNIIEGDFAGIAGDYVIIEGADASEGPPQFQIFSLKTNKEVFKSNHNQAEEFQLTRHGHKTALNFFAKIPVKCALAEEGEECWKKVLAASPMKKPTAMPDCAAAFKKAKVSVQEDALVTVPAQIADLDAPKLEWVGGKATCAPVPQ